MFHELTLSFVGYSRKKIRMKLRVWALIGALCGSISVNAAEPNVRTDIPEIYTVKKGDTLWDISSHFLTNPWLWPTIWQVNPEIKNPHLIYPGDQIHLVWIDGQPQLRLKKSVKLSPIIRIKDAPITTLREQLLFPYLAEYRLVSQRNIDKAPRVLGSSNRRGYMATGDTVWADTPLNVGESWWVYRPKVTFQRTMNEQGESEKIVTLKEIAILKVKAKTTDSSQLTVGRLRQEINQNDILLPEPLTDVTANMSFSPSAPPKDVVPTILGQVSGLSYIASSEVVVIDRGQLDKISAGNIFKLIRPGAKVKGEKGDYNYLDEVTAQHQQLGEIVIGEAMVIRPYKDFSLAVILNSVEPFQAGVLAVSPDRLPNDG